MTANWDMVPSEANVLKCALASRVVLWAFAWLVSALSPAFDSSADLAPVPRYAIPSANAIALLSPVPD